MIILGIDPGTATTGFGLIEDIKSPRCIYYGTIQTEPKTPDHHRLKEINKQLKRVIKEYNPDIMVVEKLYFFKNLKTVMPVSQARGVILFTAAQKKIPIYEFTPLQVKTVITGYGRANKKQVQKMIQVLLNLKDIPKPDDAADALGLAICYSTLFKKDLL